MMRRKLRKELSRGKLLQQYDFHTQSKTKFISVGRSIIPGSMQAFPKEANVLLGDHLPQAESNATLRMQIFKYLIQSLVLV